MTTGWLPIERGAGLEGLEYNTMKRRLLRRHVALMNDPTDRRRRLMPVTALSLAARDRLVKEEINLALSAASTLPTEAPATTPALPAPHSGALGQGADVEASAPGAPPARPAPTAQPLLPFRPLTDQEEAIESAIPPGIPRAHEKYLRDWMNAIALCSDGRWKAYRGQVYGSAAINRKRDFVAAVAKLNGVSASSVWSKVSAHREAVKRAGRADAWRATAEAILPKPRPGPASFFDDYRTSWMEQFLREFYFGPAKRSARAAYELLVKEIDLRQRAQQLAEVYLLPSYDQCLRALKKWPAPLRLAARQGPEAMMLKTGPYISRRRPERANDLWETDQQVFDVYLRGPSERYGRIWMVNFIDVASWKITGYAFAPMFSSDVVMEAAARAIETHGVPRAVHFDRGGEFNAKAFLGGRVETVSREKLYGELEGLWRALGVEPIRAIGRNPKAKVIERFHAVVTDRFFRELPGWCGSHIARRSGNPKTEDRYAKPARLAEEEREHAAWLRGEAPRSPFLTFEEGILRYVDWLERDYHQRAQHGRYLDGLTPAQAWATRQPEGGARRIPAAQLLFLTAHHRFVQARHGQVTVRINGVRFDYESPALATADPEENLEVVVARGAHKGHATVLDERGRQVCVAQRKRLMPWRPEAGSDEEDEIRQRIRCERAYRRAVMRGVRAGRLLDAAGGSPEELLALHRAQPPGASPVKHSLGLAGGTAAAGAKRFAGLESERTRQPLTSDEAAEMALALEKGSS